MVGIRGGRSVNWDVYEGFRDDDEDLGRPDGDLGGPDGGADGLGPILGRR